jgi:hypothetical protein
MCVVVPALTCRVSGAVDEASDEETISATFPPRSRGALAEIEALSSSYAEAVMTIASVDMTSRTAEAKVYRDGGVVSAYELSDNEIDELNEGEATKPLCSTA